ncbi:MBL fold metallo-hydrolase [soil metagenome]|jgi:metallo-beta-lactamase family protein
METKSSFDQPKSVYIQSLGGAGTVTGSKHLLITPGFNVLVDCGLFQGIKYLREKNWEVPFWDDKLIRACILTHAHLDHCGYLPLLVKNGYRGKIYMTGPTRDLTELILRDSAKLQEEDADKANRHGYTKHNPAKPLYNTADVEAALPYFETVNIGKMHRLNENIEFQFYPAGHIPGACSVGIRCYGKTVVFSGDIGRHHSELLAAPTHSLQADFVIMESTYGDRIHETFDISQHLAFIINETIAQGGNILIPCFAVGRAQEAIHLLYKLKLSKSIPESVPVFLDSPMAASAGKVLLKYPEWINIPEKEISQMFSSVTINQDYEGTAKIIHRKGSKIILAASGMLTGGRVLEYLKHYITDSRNTVLIIGFQAEGTRGRALLNDAHELKIHGQYYPVKAQIKEVEDLSAHADQKELLSWLKDFTTAPTRIYLVHGEPSALEALRVKIKDELQVRAVILRQDQKEYLFSIE